VLVAVSLGAVQPYLIAMAMGLGIGLERDWSKRDDERQAAGSRTFAFLALAGTLAASIDPVVVAGGAVAVGALLTAGYLETVGRHLGATTEVAAFATYLLGAVLLDDATLAVLLAVVMVVLLLARGPVHRLADEVLTRTEVEDAVRFFVIAFVVLPLLPDRDMGPYGVLNPSHIWLLVVALTGIGWAGYIAVRMVGPQRGLLFTGFAGGFVSAAATSAAMAQQARRRPELRWSAMGGALLASGSTLVQLGLVLSLASPELLRALLPTLVAGLAAISVVVAAVYWRAARHDEPGEVQQARPFALGPALLIAAVLTAVLVGARWGAEVAGSAGTVLATGLAGFADSHAAVLAAASLYDDGDVTRRTALLASAAALGSNTVLKVVLAVVAGGWRFGLQFAALLAGPVAVVAAGIVLTLR
jgi:uncharacterized membrane protein (DUF4010 family)